MQDSGALKVGGEDGSRRLVHVAKGKPAQVVAEYERLARQLDQGPLAVARRDSLKAQVALEAAVAGAYNRGLEAAAALARRHAASSRDPVCQAGEEAILGLRVQIDLAEVAELLLRRDVLLERSGEALRELADAQQEKRAADARWTEAVAAGTADDASLVMAPVMESARSRLARAEGRIASAGAELADVRARIAEWPSSVPADQQDGSDFVSGVTAMLAGVTKIVDDLVAGANPLSDEDLAAAGERYVRRVGDYRALHEREEALSTFLAGALFARDRTEDGPLPVMEGGAFYWEDEEGRRLPWVFGQPRPAQIATSGEPAVLPAEELPPRQEIAAPLWAGDGPGKPISGPAHSLGLTYPDEEPDTSHPVSGGPISGRRFLHKKSKLHCTHGLPLDSVCVACDEEAARET